MMRSELEAEESYSFSPALVALGPPHSSRTARAIRDVADRILIRHFTEGRRGLAICGPELGVGVTFIATNLAIALSQSGVSVLLVDANLHDLGLLRLIKPATPRPGLADLLDRGAAAVDVIDHRVLPNLSVLYAGNSSRNPSELLGSGLCAEIFETRMRGYDLTIADTPPANRSSDARRLSSILGHSLIIARRNMTYVDDVATLTSELIEDGANVFGTLLNDV